VAAAAAAAATAVVVVVQICGARRRAGQSTPHLVASDTAGAFGSAETFRTPLLFYG